MTVAAPAPSSPAQGPNGDTGKKGWSSRALIIVSSILSAVLASAGALVVQDVSSVWQQRRAARAAEVGRFLEASQKFDQLVTNFMRPYLSGRDYSAPRVTLRENVQAQFKLLDDAKAHLDEPRVYRASKLQDQLSKLGVELDNAPPVAAEAQALVQSIHDTSAASVCVVYDLRISAGLVPIKTDEKPCEEGFSRD